MKMGNMIFLANKPFVELKENFTAGKGFKTEVMMRLLKQTVMSTFVVSGNFKGEVPP
jgi:hypothetical protein